ncbi:MAG: hypothetical protein ABL956_06900 [Hyphomonadaceae bacterium]
MSAGEINNRVFIVDDQFLIVEFLKIWFEAHGGTAITAADAVEQALAHKPPIFSWMSVSKGIKTASTHGSRSASRPTRT